MTQKLFCTKNFWDPKIFSGSTFFIRPKNFLWLQLFSTQTFFWAKNFFGIFLLYFCIKKKDSKKLKNSAFSAHPIKRPECPRDPNLPFKIYFHLLILRISLSLINPQPSYLATFGRPDILLHFVDVIGCFFQTICL